MASAAFPAATVRTSTSATAARSATARIPGRVFKGKRMAGQYGNERVTTQNLEVVAIRADEHVLLVRGCVPGARNGLVIIRPAVKGTGRV